MRFVAAFALLAGITLICSNIVVSQDKKDPPKVKGILPPNWGKLDLTADQKQAIYKVQTKFKEEIKKLKEKEDELKAEERREMVKLLSDKQKKKLEELATGDTSNDDPKKKDKLKDSK